MMNSVVFLCAIISLFGNEIVCSDNNKAMNDALLTSTWSECDKSCAGEVHATDKNGTQIASIVCNYQCSYTIPTCNKRIVFVLDRSSSIGMLNFQRQKQFVKDLLATLGPSTDVALIASSLEADTYQALGSGNSQQKTTQIIDSMRYDGLMTMSAGGLEGTLKQVEQYKNSVVVYLSAGGTKHTWYDVWYVMNEIINYADFLLIKLNLDFDAELMSMDTDIITVSGPEKLAYNVIKTAKQVCDY